MRNKPSYHQRIFLLLLGFSWILVGCFISYQYSREKHFKAESLNAQLQLFNLRLINALDSNIAPADFIARHPTAPDSLRITVIDPQGTVCFDSSGESLSTNHLDRPEVVAAIANGSGYTIRRLSESTHQDYFYSAMQGDTHIVRTAVPYSLPLTEVLAADRDFLWFMLGITILMSTIGFFITRGLGQNITRLKDFAQRAEQGEQINEHAMFPHDELGAISKNIIRLYARLQKTTADRDCEHARVLHEQQETIRIKKQLTNNINHELKTPVAAILGYLETLVSNPELETSKRNEFLNKSLSQTQRLGNLLADISAITRMDEAEQLIRKEHLALNEIIGELTNEMQMQPLERRLRINCDFTHPLEIEGNPSLLSSIFHNLANNAAAYSSGRDIFIRLLEENDEEYTILFADNGIGVAEEHLPHIFERFYRVDSGRSRKLGGTGLGLAIVKNAVLLHGGTISASNRERGGLEFIFTQRKHAL